MMAYRCLIVRVTVVGFLVGVTTASAQLMDKKGLTLEAAQKNCRRGRRRSGEEQMDGGHRHCGRGWASSLSGTPG